MYQMCILFPTLFFDILYSTMSGKFALKSRQFYNYQENFLINLLFLWPIYLIKQCQNPYLYYFYFHYNHIVPVN